MAFTVLVVEDTELLRRMYGDKLTQDGYRVIQAADGLQALSLLRNETPDLILLDLIMPQMSGLEVLEQIKADPRLKPIPVIILSNSHDTDIQRGIELGALDYMIKNDARPNDVAEKIYSVLKRAGARSTIAPSFRVYVKDFAGDADRLVAQAGLTKRFWCPACEVELQLEMQEQRDRPGWYDAHLICPMCGREY